MNIRIYPLALLLIFCWLPGINAQEYGKIRALEQRAAQVVKQKNAFIARVLTSYAIGHELNAQGAVVRIKVDGKWRDVTAVEIIPVETGAPGPPGRVIAHELLFSTADGTLALISELKIR